MGVLAGFCDKSVTLERPAVAKTAIGASDRTFAAVGGPFRAAVWHGAQGLSRAFARREFVGDTTVVTTADVGARPGDRVNNGGTFYEVHSAGAFDNAACGPELVYVIDATRVTVS